MKTSQPKDYFAITVPDFEVFYAFFKRLSDSSKEVVFNRHVKQGPWGGRTSESTVLKAFKEKYAKLNLMLKKALSIEQSGDSYLHLKFAGKGEVPLSIKPIEMTARPLEYLANPYQIEKRDMVYLLDYVIDKEFDPETRANVMSIFCDESRQVNLPANKKRLLIQKVLKTVSEYNEFVEFFNGFGVVIDDL